MSQQVPSPTPSPSSPFPKPPGVTLGIGLTTPSPELAQICGNSGFDFVMIDMEHGPTTFETAYRMVTALAGTPASAWIRVPANDAALVKRALDTGATDIVVPMVTTREEAEQAVAAAKYPPDGIRGWGPFRAQYQWRTTMFDYSKRANDEVRVRALIEHPRAIENLDAILDVKGLGGAIAAPFDLAVNMGYLDGPGHSDVQDALALASSKIAAHGFPLMRFAVTPEQARQAIADGVTMLMLGFDTMFVPAAVQLYLGQVQRAVESTNG
ncbi:MAG: aldolase/citrate lyase family protein [Chloroflexota bacterium]